ncbi:hypothetical protein D1953_12670 [Peribacillus asahii]|uniref:BIG2 domain-containing protein n=1 Tax=Peribacillus asahii TaxID=228899 RepID=A0A398B4L4_9BACI|nr:hypothetical protein [Peribacillus asahii]RID84999.1 hypothetical protein D1953_12670 [Peribacillus asahii]USK59631.1 hypothetical protein LIT37_21225 [Peribacillus asahii]
MSKKKAIKIATASAIALTGAVAVAQPQADAATNSVDKAITKATTQVNKAFNLYYNTTKKSNKLPSGSAIRKEVKLAEQYYAAAQKEIAKNGGSKKASYTKKLEASKTSLNRAKNYVAAISVTLKASRTDLDKAIASGKQGTVASKHAALEKKIAEFEKAVTKVFGPDARRLLTKTYTTPAKAEAAAVATEVKVYAAYKEIESKKLISTDLEKAGKLIEDVKADVEKLKAKNTTLAKNLVKAAEKNNKAYEAALPAVVTAVSATNASTLTLTGTSLKNLKAEDITLAGNTVESVTAAADGKTATVVLKTLVTPNVEQTVKVKDKEFKFTYKLTATGAAITEATYDDNRANQFVAFTVNGAVANVSDLLANGYTVNFSATDKDGNNDKSTELFANRTTGELRTTGLAEEYKVQVTLTNGTNVIVSPLQTIKVKNLDLAASAINSYEFLNTTGASSVVQNSTKLVVGETGTFQNLKVVIDGTEEKGLVPTKVESSNKAVASVSGGVVTAHTPGTTTLTLTYGNTTKAVTFTVVNEKRELNSVKVTKQNSDTQIYNTTAILGNGPTLTVSPIDQYGDPVDAAVLKVESSDAAIASAPATVTSAANGKVDVAVTASKTGSTTLLFKDNANNKTLSTFGVTVTENNGVATKKLEIVEPKDSDAVKKSADNTLDLSDDNFVEYKLNQYTSEGVKNGSVNFATYTVTSSDTDVATAATAGDVLTITGKKKGTATISLKDNAGVNVGTITVTVVDNKATITGVTFKPQSKLDYAKTVDYKTFLSYSEAAAGLDPVITGITLSKSTNNSVRLDADGTNKLYIDTNGNSNYDAGDTDLGEIELTATTDSTNLTPAGASVAVNSGAKGTLIFKVKEVGKTKIYASTSLEVNVK